MTSPQPRRQKLLHRLDHRLDCRLNRSLDHFAIRLARGMKRPLRPDHLGIICRLLKRYMRLREKMARADPEHFGPRPWERVLRQIEEEKWRQEMDDAIRRVYGPDDSPPPVPAPR
jgi:hypothetical protein